jgi:hypothetical protein
MVSNSISSHTGIKVLTSSIKSSPHVSTVRYDASGTDGLSYFDRFCVKLIVIAASHFYCRARRGLLDNH